MYSIYRLNANDLDTEFVESLKTLFKDKEIEIAVYDIDETDYLTRSEANKKRLLAAVKNAEQKDKLVEVNLADLK
jgi:antitoxin YefM